MQYSENVEHHEGPLHFNEEKSSSYQSGITYPSKKMSVLFLCFIKYTAVMK